MEQCLGNTYVQVGSENFDEYLQYMGYGYFARKTAAALRPAVRLTRSGPGYSGYCFTMTSPLASARLDFRPGEPFEETQLPAGEKLLSTVTIEGSVMTHTQTHPAGRTVRHVRAFSPDRMIATTTVDGWDKTATRVYFLETEK